MFNKLFPIVIVLMILSPIFVGLFFAVSIYRKPVTPPSVTISSVQPAPSSVNPLPLPTASSVTPGPSSPPGNGKQVYVQFAAEPTETQASQTLQSVSDLSTVLPDPFPVLDLQVIHEGGYYKVVLPEPTTTDAFTLCKEVKTAGQDCIVVNY